ncbi:MAG: hypothetical protein XD95_0310 [Microgenomates bacterium 39_7]|nr:MAG: hypothetical protein XD95_0310 [Microgenomates bacterium 39_7]
MKKRSGFTLLELLIVITIIGILTSLAMVSYSSAQRRARDSQRQADLKAIQNALEQYYADHDGNYPSSVDDCNHPGEEYLPAGIPADPKTSVFYSPLTCNKTAYRFCADLEEDGSFDGTEEDFCVTNLQ